MAQPASFLNGTSTDAYEYFGAHRTRRRGEPGFQFRVYAPHALAVELIGECNDWQGTPMRRTARGVWGLFVPETAGARFGMMYKYRVHTLSGEIFDRADPVAFFSEKRPDTASIVYDLEDFPWADSQWMAQRRIDYNRPLSIYEVHAGSWQIRDIPGDERFYNYEELAWRLIPYVKEMGFTHIEFLPLAEHPFDGSWGYQGSGFFSATSRYDNPRKLMQLINLCHHNGIGVLLDFVPVHFVTDFFSLHQYDGSFLYESADPQKRYTSWGSARFDLSKPFVRSFLKSSLHFWCRYFHFDGIRFDAVSNLIHPDGDAARGLNPEGISFLQDCNRSLHEAFPTLVLIAEDSSMYPKVTAPVEYDGLGFDYKWNLGWMNDALEYLSLSPAQRSFHREKFQHSIHYFYQELYILPLSHDEVVHGKHTILGRIPGTYEQQFLQLKTFYLYFFTHPGKKLSFMGNELGEFREWDESAQLSWNLLDYPAHEDFHSFFKRLLQLYCTTGALFEDEYDASCFRWITPEPAYPAVFAYQRQAHSGDTVLVLLNFSDQPVQPSLNLPEGSWRILLTTWEQEDSKSTVSLRDKKLSFPIPAFGGCLLQPAEQSITPQGLS